MAKIETLGAEIARAVRELREDRGWSQEQLAAEMASLGFRWSRMTVTEVEGRRQRSVSIEELLGLAHVFDVGLRRLLRANFRHQTRARNAISVTSEWTIGRGDVDSLIDTGQRSEVKALNRRLDLLLHEAAVLDAEAATLAKLSKERKQEVERIRHELDAARHELDAASNRRTSK